ncbi:MAG: hypothetical protein UZ07_CHB004002429 [Chlorobi bacterium OLB7]|nr:MAG: hypothetical protein UZ07_CHB004002429 [Chlorobi bacterium OLB7]
MKKINSNMKNKMKLKKCISIIWLYYLSIIASLQLHGQTAQPNLSDILRDSKTTNSYVLVVFFVSPSECLKCNIMFEHIQFLLSRKYKNKIRTAVFVECDRIVELNLFKKGNPNYDYYQMDSKYIRTLFNASKDAKVIILNDKGGKLLSVSNEDFYKKIELVMRSFLEKISN